MKLQSNSDSETREIGRRIGERLKAGDVICLFGDLGAGKTTLVKGIASAFGINERDITSASFTIIAEYDSPVPFYHIDLYRLAYDEVSELGLQEYLGTDGVAVIEWAERAQDYFTDDFIKIHLSHRDYNGRDIEIKGMEL
jgi:tRNA threonylcarbamoyladenosine biosynthesis protein TsaE